ncbi:DcaP family trimeric outer membrane transporter [Thalassotalea castellviae]|uniref:DcaP family trimeric outer membrane transporter n=1 Tax=Thalassotalea castellviae TaxID=3075612 RepID=A0ABU3A1X9_9GAMM|nr:DcaP family trimeric outer membrane transporter [Thalassotalea sp. W431]MDT0604179.1 DcaP family trimeric outer membrane transporter [Thalassotalea sp. W431]
MLNGKKSLLATSLLFLACSANAGYSIQVNDTDTITFGGYIQGDIRYIDGNAASTLTNDDFWIGHVVKDEISNTRFHADSTRFNTKYVSGDITGFIEFDLFGGGGNEKLTNSRHPRLRHAFIKYKNWTVGQTWSTFVNTSAIAEAADFGGPLVASAFIRQDLVRYTNGGFQVSIENPESYGGYVGSGGYGSKDSMPDVIGKYTFKGDWGNVSVAAVAKQLETALGESESALGYGIAGRINTFGKDDFRFQLHGGNTGRYVGAAAATDLVGEEVEETTSILVSYRHFWTEDLRSNFFYGNTQTEESDRDRTHWGVNVFKAITPKLSYGVEVGNFDAEDLEADSNYAQLSVKYVL